MISTGVGRTWESVVEGYLHACFKDAEAARAIKLTNQQAQFLQKFACDSVSEDYLHTSQFALSKLEKPAGMASWQIVEQTCDSVLVEIPKSKQILYRVPFEPIRILLNRVEEFWQISNIFEICISCNLQASGVSRIPGECNLCRGTGNSLVDLSGIPVQCTFCSGTGSCQRCTNERMPGWRRAHCLTIKPHSGNR